MSDAYDNNVTKILEVRYSSDDYLTNFSVLIAENENTFDVAKYQLLAHLNYRLKYMREWLITLQNKGSVRFQPETLNAKMLSDTIDSIQSAKNIMDLRKITNISCVTRTVHSAVSYNLGDNN